MVVIDLGHGARHSGNLPWEVCHRVWPSSTRHGGRFWKFGQSLDFLSLTMEIQCIGAWQ